MKKEKFRNWLCRAKGFQDLTAGSRVSNCERIEKIFGDLDELFEQDGLDRPLKNLKYSKNDFHSEKRPPIPIEGDAYNGMATLRSAVKLYKDFAQWEVFVCKSDGMRGC